MMDKQEHREAYAMKTNMNPNIADTQEDWEEQLSLLDGIDSELQHMIEEVQEWEERLLEDFDMEW